MRCLPFHIQALLIFLTSATAVPVFGGRLSDLAVALFTISLIFYKPREIAGVRSISIFLLIISLTLLLSTANSGAVDARKFESGIANTIAVPFGVLLSLICVWLMDSDQVLKVISSYSQIVVLMCSFFILWQLFYGPPGWIVYEEEFDRFSALSQNPNQLALYLLPVPFFSVIGYTRNIKRRWVSVAEIVLAVTINLFLLGKALFIGWGISVVFLFLLGWIWFGPIRLYGVRFFGRVMVSFALFGFVSPIILALYKGDTAGSQEDQGDTRVQLWKHGFDAWTDSVVIGHGPGHYSGLESSFQNMEAHNFLIDWLSAYGLLGGIALVSYCAWLLFFSFKRRAWIVLALYTTLLVQAMFHFYGRQPLFWILLIFGYFIASSGKGRKRVKS